MAKIADLSSVDRVTKSYLIDYLVVHVKLTRPAAEAAVNGVIEGLVEAFKEHVDVNISNVGTLRPKTYAPRDRRNPRTGEAISVPELTTIRFTASPTLVAVLNGRETREQLARKAPKSH